MEKAIGKWNEPKMEWAENGMSKNGISHKEGNEPKMEWAKNGMSKN